GLFMACSAGNNAASTTIAFPASLSRTFAVGWGDWAADQPMGNHGTGLDVTVADGNWPAYVENGRVFEAGAGGGGTSVSCALVSGVAALMQTAGSMRLGAEEKKAVIRHTTRLSPLHEANQGADGFHPSYGFGFIDAHHAVK